jgi:HK97 family phage prohead protease
METLKRTLFNKIEYRTLENEGKRIIEAVIPYDSQSGDLGGYREVITDTAFTRSIESGEVIYAYLNHDTSKILGSTKNGTLELRSEAGGLRCKVYLGNTTFANDAWETVKRGDCDNLSFGFSPVSVENRGNLRYLRSVNLREVSFCVSQPAYADTTSVAYTRSKSKKDYTGMRNTRLITRSIDSGALEELIAAGELITDRDTAQELLSLIDPAVLKELTAPDTEEREEAEKAVEILESIEEILNEEPPEEKEAGGEEEEKKE